MKLIPTLFFWVFLASIGFGQTGSLPEILRPDESAESEAQRLGAEVFKILPRGMFKDISGSNFVENNLLGVREGGAYYSFARQSHSYNQIPQIGLEQGYIQAGGFHGANYGFMIDLGEVALADISPDLETTRFLLNYVPPNLISDIRDEQRKSRKYVVSGQVFVQRLPAIVGHTYLLRSISFGDADNLVALQIVSKNEDQSLMILWKLIKTFDIPRIKNPDETRFGKKGLEEVINRPACKIFKIQNRASSS